MATRNKNNELRRHQLMCKHVIQKKLMLAFGIITIAFSCIRELTKGLFAPIHRDYVRELTHSSYVSSLKPRTKYSKVGTTASQNITASVKGATCREVCDSSAKWERLPLFHPMNVVRHSAIIEVADDHDYLKSLRHEHGWNTTAWAAHDRRQSECNFVCEIPFGFVDGSGHVCAVNDGVCFIQQDCQEPAPDLPPDVFEIARYNRVLVISQMWGHAMYHGILESAIKLGDVLSMLQADESIHVHVPGSADTVSVLFPPLLADLGIEPSRLVSGPLIARKLFLPRATPCMHPSTRQLLKFRQAIENTDCYRKYYSRSHMPASGILLIKRQPGTRRSFVNHEELKRALAKFAEARSHVLHEFSSPDGPFKGPPREKCGIIRDMLRFKQSKVIVAPHGAGLTNILLCNPKTIIVETHTASINHVFTSISMRLGLRHLSLFDVESNHETPMTANVSEIIYALNALI